MPIDSAYLAPANAVGNLVEGLQRNKLMNFQMASQAGADQRAQQAFDMEQQAMQEQAAKQQQYNALLSEYLGPNQGALAAGVMGQPQPQQQSGGNALLLQMYQMDPQRTAQMVQFQQQQQQAARQQEIEKAKRSYLEAQYALQSDSIRNLVADFNAFPEFRDYIVSQGYDPKEVPEEQYREWAEQIMAHAGPIAGIGPDVGGGTRVQSTQILDDGEIAIVKSDGTLQRTGEYARNPMQLADIEGGVALVNRLTGQTLQLSDAQGEIDAAARRKEAEGRAGATGTAQANRWAQNIEAGQAAADSLAIVKRGLELLQDTSTGGVNALKLWASNRLGVTGADEGELSANLGKAVLSQLRATFGAQFTEREGARLAEIEAGFGKSTAANRRLLEQAAQIMDRAARRGIQSAIQAGDDFARQEIEDALKFRIDYGETQNSGASTLEVGTVKDGYRYNGGNPADPKSWSKQ